MAPCGTSDEKAAKDTIRINGIDLFVTRIIDGDGVAHDMIPKKYVESFIARAKEDAEIRTLNRIFISLAKEERRFMNYVTDYEEGSWDMADRMLSRIEARLDTISRRREKRRKEHGV